MALRPCLFQIQSWTRMARAGGFRYAASRHPWKERGMTRRSESSEFSQRKFACSKWMSSERNGFAISRCSRFESIIRIVAAGNRCLMRSAVRGNIPPPTIAMVFGSGSSTRSFRKAFPCVLNRKDWSTFDRSTICSSVSRFKNSSQRRTAGHWLVRGLVTSTFLIRVQCSEGLSWCSTWYPSLKKAKL